MAFRYSNVEYTEMVRMLARCDDNVSEACRQYAARYPNLPTPSRATMLAATQRLRDYGQFQPMMRDSGRPRRRTVRKEEEILEFFEADPAASTNDAARRFNVSQYFAWSLIHNEVPPRTETSTTSHPTAATTNLRTASPTTATTRTSFKSQNPATSRKIARGTTAANKSAVRKSRKNVVSDKEHKKLRRESQKLRKIKIENIGQELSESDSRDSI